MMARISIKSNRPAVEKQRRSQVRQQRAVAQAALQQYDAALLDLTDNWGGLSAVQKTEALRTMLVVAAKSIRFLMLRFSQ